MTYDGRQVIGKPCMAFWLACLAKSFNNISAISWRSVLLVEETRVPRETPHLPQVTDTFYYTMLYRVHLAMSWIHTDNVSG
jgi:hypothetical protein